ncbi:hypothetical protein [Couchioplanes caeruleus]|uniref:Uncharacterized protein n=1 Tax=Couchioplanes caeruleus subsp. caeruleus TaxID=56427 RepID=A0A1K0GNI2_9ACTN|nr:hypothetical protein [Couchioplanes caeruleus]OJF13918.1 hypothetical protein BG844_12510 [Couchioplanes caeruleus subsp. caeruleus]
MRATTLEPREQGGEHHDDADGERLVAFGEHRSVYPEVRQLLMLQAGTGIGAGMIMLHTRSGLVGPALLLADGIFAPDRVGALIGQV